MAFRPFFWPNAFWHNAFFSTLFSTDCLSTKQPCSILSAKRMSAKISYHHFMVVQNFLFKMMNDQNSFCFRLVIVIVQMLIDQNSLHYSWHYLFYIHFNQITKNILHCVQVQNTSRATIPSFFFFFFSFFCFLHQWIFIAQLDIFRAGPNVIKQIFCTTAILP